MKRQGPAQTQQKTMVTAVAEGSLQRKCACGNHTVAGGECAECAKGENRLQHGKQGVSGALSSLSRTPAMQTKLAIGASNDPLEQEAERVADQVLASPAPFRIGRAAPLAQRVARQAAGEMASAPDSVDRALASPGSPLESTLRRDMEQRFGHDFSQVRVHSDAASEQSARAVNARAYTVGRDIVFGTAQYAPATPQGRHLLAHELTHVVQQRERSARDGGEPVTVRNTALPVKLQRYEAGEHARFGETGAELQAAVAARAFTYKVKPGEHLEKIAARFKLTVKALKEANAGKVKKWRATQEGEKPDTGGVVEGFNAGAVITIPPVLNEVTKEALKSKELIFTLNGVALDYGEGIAMGDLYENAAQMLAAPATELTALAALIKKEKLTGVLATTKEWNDATNGRYTKLAEKNEAHFAPSNPSLVAVSPAAHGSDNKTEWEHIHKAGLGKSQAGLKDQALQINSFGDHFLTDAFSAGHLVNKRDVMEKFKGGLTKSKATTTAPSAFIGDAKALFDNVATTAFVGSVETEFSKYETVDSFNRKGEKDPSGWFHPSINDAKRFSSLLQGIQDKEPDVLANVVAKAVHDTLNSKPGGVPVENANGDKWDLSGDKTLNAKTKEVGRKAVAQSQLNIFDVFKKTGALDYREKFKKVWDYVPVPTASGEAGVQAAVGSGTDPKNTGLRAAIVALINAEYLLIIRELVTRKFLRKA